MTLAHLGMLKKLDRKHPQACYAKHSNQLFEVSILPTSGCGDSKEISYPDGCDSFFVIVLCNGKGGSKIIISYFCFCPCEFILKTSVGNCIVQRGELDSCFLDKGVHGGNMAATDPAESPPKRHKSPAEKVEKSGLEKEAVEAGCPPNNDGTTPRRAVESLGNEQTASVGIIGRVANRSEVTIGSGDGSDKTCSLPDNTTSANEMTDPAGNDGWEFDWSETEKEDSEPKIQKQENNGKCGKLAFVMVFC